MSTPAAYKERVLSREGLLHYWPADAEDGLVDRMGGDPLVAQGGVTVGGASGPGDALTLSALDGADDLFLTPFVFENGAVYTFELWLRRTADTDADALFGGNVAAVHPYLRLQAGSDDVQFETDASGSPTLWADAGPAPGEIAHVMLVFDEPGDLAALVVNAVDQGEQAVATPYSATPGALVFGARSTGADPFAGDQGHYAIYEGDRREYALEHWGWGLSTAASRSPSVGLPSDETFPRDDHLPTGETL